MRLMDACRGVSCGGFWDALVVGAILEEHGVQVRRPDEVAPLTMVASGMLEEIKAAVAQFGREFPGANPIVIAGEGPVSVAPNRQSADSRYHIKGDLRIDEPALPEAGPRRCSAPTAKGRQCKLPAEPGAAACAIHSPRSRPNHGPPR
jgi:hypothetical protein